MQLLMYICWINIIEFNRTTYTIYYCSSLKYVNKVRSTTLSAIDLQTITISVGTNLSLVTRLYLFLGGRTFQLHRLPGYSINIKTLPEVQFDSLKTKSKATLSSSNIVLLMNRQEGMNKELFGLPQTSEFEPLFYYTWQCQQLEGSQGSANFTKKQILVNLNVLV